MSYKKKVSDKTIMAETNKREIRSAVFDVTITDGEDSRTVEGYALLFDTPSDGLPFKETIERGALDGVIEKSNVFAILNHDKSRGIFARSKNGSGTLSLTVDTRGLKYKFEAPKTALGDELLEYLKRGDITESSFEFTTESDVWEHKEDESWERTIKKIEQLYAVSPVYDGAYSKTTVYMRGKEEAEKELEAKLKEQRDKDLEDYYSELNNMLN